MMKLLLLGGTSFVGRHFAEEALRRGHQVDLFHRGKTNADLFPELRHFHGDRLEAISLPEGESWDSVIDTSAYIPRAVKIAGEALADRASRYVFISTISVYQNPPAGSDESADVIELEDPTVESISAETYGGLKVLCEREVARHWAGRSLILRPGLIVGPYDPTDRFTYWIAQIGENRPFVAPQNLDQPMQFVHGGDLANLGLDAIQESGTVTVVGPEHPTSMGQLFDIARSELGSESQPFYAPLAEGESLPMALTPEGFGFFQLSDGNARKLGLRHRPVAQTVRETWEWWRAQGRELKVGLSAARQTELFPRA